MIEVLLMNELGEFSEPEPPDKRREVYAGIAAIDVSRLAIEEPMTFSEHTRTCPWCGGRFVSSRGRVYCCVDCKRAAERARERERRIRERGRA